MRLKEEHHSLKFLIDWEKIRVEIAERNLIDRTITVEEFEERIGNIIKNRPPEVQMYIHVLRIIYMPAK